MINWESKKQHLDYLLPGSGYAQREVDRIKEFYRVDKQPLLEGDEIVIQALIDGYDPLPMEKKKAKHLLIEDFEKATKSLEDSYPEAEKRTFTKQEIEARSYLLDNTIYTPTITAIAAARNISVLEVVNRIILKADEYTSQVASLVGLRQLREDQIDIAEDWETARNIKLNS